MQIDKYRSSFSILICDNDRVRAESIARPLKTQRYNVAVVSAGSALEKAIAEEPPHILILSSFNKELVEPRKVMEFKQALPETHFLVIKNSGDDNSIFGLCEKNLVFTILHYPFEYENLILHTVDNAIRLCLKDYLNEGLREELQLLQDANSLESEIYSVKESQKEIHLTENLPVKDKVDLGDEELTKYYKQLNSTITLKAAVQVYVGHLFEFNGNTPTLFFKYLAGYHSLVLSYIKGLDLGDFKGVGIELGRISGFHESMLENVTTIEKFNQMIRDIFQVSGYTAEPLICQGRVRGVFVQLNSRRPVSEGFVVEKLLFQKQVELLLVNDRLHRVDQTDQITHVLNRQTLMKKLSEEVSRSRRTQLPVSFILLSIDDFSNMLRDQNSESLERLLKSIGSILSKNSRVNDIIGRVGSDEFGIILPHTSMRGAAIKAERIRKIIERADFSKVLPGHSSITLCAGTSEYPSYCNDADDLVMSADEALYQIKTSGSNKVSIATVKDNFQPDFIVKE